MKKTFKKDWVKKSVLNEPLIKYKLVKSINCFLLYVFFIYCEAKNYFQVVFSVGNYHFIIFVPFISLVI